MTFLSDEQLRHLQQVTGHDLPEPERYRWIEQLGRGGMGTVHLAEDLPLERQVAIKVLHAHGADAAGTQRLLREARILAGLEHPGIVPIHDVGTLPDGRLFYVMQYVRGQRLDAFFTQEHTLGDRLTVFERICETVAFAHAAGVIHRDLKPANIMLGAFGEVRVLDWGIAKRLAESGDPSGALTTQSSAESEADSPTVTRATAAGTVVGTPGFMAPEQARGDLARVDERSDVFALGGVLYYLLTGRPPLTPEAFETLRAGGPLRIADVRQAAPHVPRALEAICGKALAAEPAGRYRSVAEMRCDVQQFRGGFAVSALREGPLDATARVLWKYRGFVLLVLAYILMRSLLLSWPA